tara:strand:- start:182 stop:517 length:336 start_codon:yes stop_codon:yes gene_type:complete
MFEVLLGVGLGLLLASNVALWLKLNRCYWDLHKLIGDAADIEAVPIDIGSVRDEIEDTIQGFMQNLHVPTASDHFIGGLSQIMQMWAMKKFSPMVEQLQNEIVHNPEPTIT